MGFIGARPAGACTCERAATENQKVLGNACACGQRAAGILSFSLPHPFLLRRRWGMTFPSYADVCFILSCLAAC